MSNIFKGNFGAKKFSDLDPNTPKTKNTKTDDIVTKELTELGKDFSKGLINAEEMNGKLDLLESKHKIQILRAVKSPTGDVITMGDTLGGINLEAKYHLVYRYDGDKESQLTYDFMGNDLVAGNLFWNKIVSSNPNLTHRKYKSEVLGLIEYMSCKTLKKPIRPDIPKEIKVLYKKSLKGKHNAKEIVQLVLAGYLGFFAMPMLKRDTTTLVVNDYPATSQIAINQADAISKVNLKDDLQNDAHLKELDMTQEKLEKQMLSCGTVVLTYGDEDVGDLHQQEVSTKHDFFQPGSQLKENTKTLGSA